MEKLTYAQAYDKIIQAYFRDEIEPYAPSFCFCGTLCDNTSRWANSTYNRIHNDYGEYLGVQYVEMERALLDPIGGLDKGDPEYEEKIFEGMCAALEVLKKIHRSRGENVDEVPEFKKRVLVER